MAFPFTQMIHVMLITTSLLSTLSHTLVQVQVVQLLDCRVKKKMREVNNGRSKDRNIFFLSEIVRLKFIYARMWDSFCASGRIEIGW